MVDFIQKYVDLIDLDEGWGFCFDEATETTHHLVGNDYILNEEDVEKICARAYIYEEIGTYIYFKGNHWIYVSITGKMISRFEDEYFVEVTMVTEREEGEEEVERKTYTPKGAIELKDVLLSIVKEEEA